MPEILKSIIVPIHRAGWPFILIFASFAAIGGLFWSPIFFFGVILTAWCAYFFRDPIRVTPTRAGLVISPADGVVQMITKALPPAELDMPIAALTRVSIFMNIFDVHVNRLPVSGQVAALSYSAGKFLNASLDKASEENERQSVKIRMEDGIEIAFVQIAGLIARRILCWIQPEQVVKVGERYGLIRFGSRVDIYLPEGVSALVIEGQKVIAGETILADMLSEEEPRRGIVR